MQNGKGFGFLATLATLGAMLGFRKGNSAIEGGKAIAVAPQPMSRRNWNRSKYSRHQGERECARRLQQDQLMFYPSLAALLRDDDGERMAA